MPTPTAKQKGIVRAYKSASSEGYVGLVDGEYHTTALGLDSQRLMELFAEQKRNTRSPQ